VKDGYEHSAGHPPDLSQASATLSLRGFPCGAEVGQLDIVAVSEAVATLVAAGAGKELAKDTGRGLVTAMVDRIRKVFGSDRRSVDALEHAWRPRMEEPMC
jgi:hypothetical protein